MRIAFVIFVILFFCGIAQAGIPMGALPYAIGEAPPPSGASYYLLPNGSGILLPNGSKLRTQSTVKAAFLLPNGNRIKLPNDNILIK